MINISIKLKEDIPYYFKVTDHAKFDQYGKDIVCAAVSVLTINAINSIKSFCNDETAILVDEKNAIMEIHLETIENEHSSKELELLSQSLYLGLKMIFEEYGEKYIRIKEET